MVGERPASDGRRVLAGNDQFSLTRRGDPVQLVLAGELDLRSVPELSTALAGMAGRAGILHLDLAGVRFCDLTALRAILKPTQPSGHHQNPARAVVLHHPSVQVLRILQLTGWHTLPGLTIDGTQSKHP